MLLSLTVNPLTLISAMFIGKSVRDFASTISFNIATWTIRFLALMLVFASFFKIDESESIKYQFDHELRWTGPWNSPNIFGLLMGCGIILASGQLIRYLNGMVHDRQIVGLAPVAGKVGAAVSCFLATAFCARGILHSYSRGAWIAGLSGTGYLLMNWRTLYSRFWAVKASYVLPRSFPSFFRRNGFSLFCIIISTAIICFWCFRQSEWRPSHRAFSNVSSLDFSCRNRLAAWEGALQITGDWPWLGSGWGQPEIWYKYFFLPSNLTESAAIEMNDYLLLGATLGIPAFFCFGMYLLRSFFKGTRLSGDSGLPLNCPGEWSRFVDQSASSRDSIWLKTSCKAGALVLAVGFWFDGGLFKLATASVFWILLELGNVDYRGERELSQNG